MSEDQTAAPQDATVEPQSQPSTQDAGTEASKTEFEGEFDAERAKKLIEKLRTEKKAASDKVKEYEPLVKKARDLEEAQKSTEQRAQDAATAAEKRATDALHRIAAAEVKAALTGVVPDPSAIVEDLNLQRFVGDDGDVDTDAIAKLRDKYNSFTPQQQKGPAPNRAQGVNGSKPHDGQLTIEDMKRMSPEQIVEAQNKGLFDTILNVQK